MDELQLKSFVALQLANKLQKDRSSLDEKTIEMIVQQHKDKVVDFLQEMGEVNDEVTKAFLRQKKFQTDLNDFLESSYEDFQRHPLSIEPLEIEIVLPKDTINNEDDTVALGVLDETENVVIASESMPNLPDEIKKAKVPA